MSHTAVMRPPGGRQPPGEPIDEHDLYPVHEEDDVPEKGIHETQVRYLRGALAAHLSDKSVAGNICMYWEERNYQQYAAPDVLVVDGVLEEPLPVHLRWSDPPALLVIEVGSRSTFRYDEGPKLEIYGLDLGVPEYLYYHPTRHDLRLYRLGREGYAVVPPDARGWLHSETLDVWFAEDETGRLRVYTPEGEPLPSQEEEASARHAAEARARYEARRAEQEARRAEQEAAARAAAEQRIAELEAELRRQQEQRSP